VPESATRRFLRRSLITLGATGALASAAHAATINVSSASALANAVNTANGSGGGTTIALADGTYTLGDTLTIKVPNVSITGQSGNRAAVIIQGDAMSASATVKNLIKVSASNFTITNVTLQKSGWHLIQVGGESNADGTVIRNVVFRDAWEQMLKVSIDQANYAVTGDNGIIENSVFEYTAGIGPQYYIGGIDVHGGKNWVVRGNTFRSIISPSQTVAEFAIHFWNQSADALVEKNIIVNCDRGIGFGLDGRGNSRGIIRNNMIYHSAGNGSFADTSIYLDQSPGTQIYNNSIYMENSYPRSIEYRFAESSGVLIVNNLSNRPAGARDGASATEGSNVWTAAASWFVTPSQGNLRLASANTSVVDKGRAVTGLTDDIDGNARTGSVDIGADEYGGAAAVKPNPPTNVTVQ